MKEKLKSIETNMDSDMTKLYDQKGIKYSTDITLK